MTVSPVQQFDAHSVHHSQDQRIPIGFSSTTKLQPLGGVPVVAPVSLLPSKSSLVGTADLRYFKTDHFHV